MPVSEEDEKSTQTYAALAVGFVCLVIGVPLWWKTTEVYRVSLPYNDISDLSNLQLKYTIDLEVLNADEQLSDIDLTQISKLLRSNLENHEDLVVKPNYRINVRQATEKQRKEILSYKSISELDQHFTSPINQYQIVLLPVNSQIKISKPYLGNGRAFYFCIRDKEVSAFANQISGVIDAVVVKEKVLSRTFKKGLGARDLKPDKESMRSVKYHPGYDIVFTLVNPQPDILDVQWNIEGAVKAHLGGLIEEVEKYTNINVKSQVLYFTGLLRRPQKDPNSGEFHYTEKDLPHTINPLEVKLGSHASNNPTLNFLVYVPSRDQHPLHIINESGNKLLSNSYLSPRWGGIFIHNFPSPPENSTLPHTVHLDMKLTMEIFLTQLRLFLNFNSQVTEDVASSDIGSKLVRHWELDTWLRKRCLENMGTSIATLQSLTQLLEGISNIVIQDDIGKQLIKSCIKMSLDEGHPQLLLYHQFQVEDAVTGIREGQRYLNGGQLEKAFTQSKKAIVSSEMAFFDPSLLELLYFPEDQKFAIYIPLFLPVSLPVLGSLYKAFQWMKAKQKKPKQE